MRIAIAILGAAAVLALAGCGGGGGSNSSKGGKAATASRATISIEVKGGKPVGGIKRATVRKGQDVSLVVDSDVADEVHLHGYDLHSDVKAGGTAHIDFKADIAGEFEAELESRKLQILELTVK
jgi:hypothetical protein